MRGIETNIKFGIIILLCFALQYSCKEHDNRVKIGSYALGDSISSSRIVVLNKNKNLDFPYKEVVLKSDSNIYLNVIGKTNTIYAIRKVHIASDVKSELLESVTFSLGFMPDSQKNASVSNIWNCDIYTWNDKHFFDLITLSSCKHNKDNLKGDKIWELSITNDTIYTNLLKKYNAYY